MSHVVGESIVLGTNACDHPTADGPRLRGNHDPLHSGGEFVPGECGWAVGAHPMARFVHVTDFQIGGHVATLRDAEIGPERSVKVALHKVASFVESRKSPAGS